MIIAKSVSYRDFLPVLLHEIENEYLAPPASSLSDPPPNQRCANPTEYSAPHQQGNRPFPTTTHRYYIGNVPYPA
jgi:hypothetical protein